jgi:hypothetical protein
MAVPSHNSFPSKPPICEQEVTGLARDIFPTATPAQRKRGKSLSRRTGQDGHIEKSGRWFVVRFWKDIAGHEKRVHVRERICPISGPCLLSKSERKRKAREIIQASGADSPEYFKQVVKQNSGITFREQSESWLNISQNRNRKPIRATTAEDIQRALDKWILPEIGDLPLSEAAKYPAMKKLVAKMNASALSPKTVNTYFRIAAGVITSVEDEDGNPLYPRKWNPGKLDLPIVDPKGQHRPTIDEKTMTFLASWEGCVSTLGERGFKWSGRVDLNHRPPGPEDWSHEQSTSYTERS